MDSLAGNQPLKQAAAWYRIPSLKKLTKGQLISHLFRWLFLCLKFGYTFCVVVPQQRGKPVADLNPKQEKFCQLYVQLGNASEAYRQAYNSSAKPESVHVRASELLSNSKVSVRVDEIREALRANHGITLKNLLDELEEARKAALAAENPQASAAVSATMSKAKLLGLDKPEPKEKDQSQPITIKIVDAKKAG